MKLVSGFLFLAGVVIAHPTADLEPRVVSSSQLSKIFAFGDSYSTVGFNVNGLQPNATNPIGNPAFPGKTTSGGRNWIDSLITKYNHTLSLAYDFAVGGATVDSTLVAPYQSSVKSLVQQGVYFKGHYSAHPTVWNSNNSLFTIWFGINDIMNGYFAAPAHWTTLAPLIIKQYFTQAQALYDLGARRFLFLTIPPIQKTPRVLGWNATAQAQVVSAVESYNRLLKAGYDEFRSNKSESTTKTWLFNTTGVFNTVLADPVGYGAKDASCYSGNGVSCLWWNDFHPGLAIHNLLASTIANLTSF